jgi:hypothetical protein
VTGATRSEALPNIPTVGEFVPGYEAIGWYGLGAPKGTPAAIIDKLNNEINALLADSIIKARLFALGAEPRPMTSAACTPVVTALMHATRTIPTVFVSVSNPIGSGFVASMARPGGNITGFTLLHASIAGKYVSMLKEMVPRLARVALMYNPDSVPASGTFFSGAFMEAAAKYEVQPIITEVHDPAEIGKYDHETRW